MGTRELMDESSFALDLPVFTPYGYVKAIASEPGNVRAMTTFFALLCRLAGLPCKIIKGYDKQLVNYEVGDDIKQANCMWNVVFVDGSWRIVDPVAAFTIFVSTSGPADWVLVEESGQATRQRFSGEQTGQNLQRLNEDAFLPDPENFIYFSCSEDPAWQLLSEPWSKEKFINTPVVSSKYLHEKWHVQDKYGAIIDAPGGKCSVSLDQIPEGNAAIGYRLFYNEKKSKRKFPNELQLENYIKNVGSISQQSVLTRLPQPGIYKLQILDGKKCTLCLFLIKTSGKLEDPKPFPDIPETGLGFNQAAVDAGLVDPSREDGIVVAREGEKVRFKFRSSKPLDVVTRLVHSMLPSEQLDSHITKEEEDGVITVNVTVPWDKRNPEFSLQVDARPKDSMEELVNVINYLLTPDRELAHAIKGQQQQLNDDLTAATSDNDIQRLESALREFRAGHVQNKDLYVKAVTRLYDLHHSAIEEAGTSDEELQTAVREADQSQVAYLVHRTLWYQHATERLRRLRRLASVRHDVDQLSTKQVKEVQSYNHPHHSVSVTLQATYILLGEKSKHVQKWGYIQSLLRRHGDQSILQRIKNHDVSTVEKQRVKKASDLLQSCTADQVRSVSIGAAAFYNWSKGVVESHSDDDKDNDNTEQRDKDDINRLHHSDDLNNSDDNKNTNDDKNIDNEKRSNNDKHKVNDQGENSEIASDTGEE